MECRWRVNRGVNGVSIEGRSRVSMEGIDRHSTAEAVSTHDLTKVPLLFTYRKFKCGWEKITPKASSQGHID